nr:glycosyltransferase [uncultured Desulfobacter sp.]
MSYNLNRPIRVLQLGSPTGLYGAERWILALVRNLNPTKVYSIVSAVKDDPSLEVPLCLRADELGIKTKIFTAYGKYNFAAARQLKQYIIKNHIDILHTHGYKQDMVGLSGVAGTKCKIVSTPHGWTKHPDFKLRLYELFNRLIFAGMNAVAPLSEELHYGLMAWPFLNNKLHLIKNGVDFLELDAAQDTAPEVITWREQGHLIIGYIGRLVKGKGLDTLIKAVAKLKNTKFKLVLIGEGEEKEPLYSLAMDLGVMDHVHFMGFKPNRLDYLNGFDIFVLPSLSEGIPRCLMEAMGKKVPVIASDIPGCKMLVQDSISGLLFSPGSPDSLLDKLQCMIESPNIKPLVNTAYRFILQNYSASAMAYNYLYLYKKITNQN